MPTHFLPGGYPNPDPYYMTAEEEQAMELRDQCDCDHGRVLQFSCEDRCDCGLCPEVVDCPHCVGQVDVDDNR